MKPTIRASSLDQLLACPGSRTLQAIVEERQGDEGKEGDAVHAKVAGTLVGEHSANGPPLASVTVPKMSEWIVSFCIRQVTENVPFNWSLEVELGLAYEFDQFILSGHVDAVGISPDGAEAIGFDWKSGYVAVDAAEMNEQVLGYIVLLKRAYPGLRKIAFYVVQPRNDEDEGFERVSGVVVEFTDMGDPIIPAFEARVNDALADPMQINAGLKQCLFCIGCSCPEIQEKQREQKMKLTPEILAKIKATPDDATLGDFVVTAKMLAQPSEDALELAKARLDAQGFLDSSQGIRITQKIENGAYEVPDKPKFYAELRKIVPDDDKRAEALSFSMMRSKDVIADVMKVPKTGKKGTTAESIFDATLRPLVKQETRRRLIFT